MFLPATAATATHKFEGGHVPEMTYAVSGGTLNPTHSPPSPEQGR